MFSFQANNPSKASEYVPIQYGDFSESGRRISKGKMMATVEDLTKTIDNIFKKHNITGPDDLRNMKTRDILKFTNELTQKTASQIRIIYDGLKRIDSLDEEDADKIRGPVSKIIEVLKMAKGIMNERNLG